MPIKNSEGRFESIIDKLTNKSQDGYARFFAGMTIAFTNSIGIILILGVLIIPVLNILFSLVILSIALSKNFLKENELTQKDDNMNSNTEKLLSMDDLKEGKCVAVASNGKLTQAFKATYSKKYRTVFFAIPRNYKVLGYKQ